MSTTVVKNKTGPSHFCVEYMYIHSVLGFKHPTVQVYIVDWRQVASTEPAELRTVQLTD